MASFEAEGSLKDRSSNGHIRRVSLRIESTPYKECVEKSSVLSQLVIQK